MSLLSGIGNWIRKEADNVGSFVTGQPAHGQQPAQPNQPNQPQQIQSRPPQANNAPQLIIKQGSNSNIPINRAQNPQNISVNNSAPPPINIRTNSLQAPNPLMQKQKLTMGSLKVNAQPNAQQINVPRPQPGGIHSWNTPTSQPNLAHSIMSAPGKLLNADKAIVNTGVNMGKGLEQGASGLVKTAIIAPAVETMAGFSHNPYVKQAAQHYGDQSRAQAAGFIQGAITRPAAELAATVKHPFNQFSYHPNSLVEQAVFGNRPVQNVAANVASNYDAHKNLNPAVRLGVAGADLAGQVLNILPTAAGATKLAKVTGAKAILAGRPAKLADSDVAALANYRRQAGTGQMMTDETYNRGIAAARKAGLKHTDFKGIDNLLGQYRTYYTKVAQRKDALNNIPIGLSTKDVSPKPNVPEVQPIKITPPPKIAVNRAEPSDPLTSSKSLRISQTQRPETTLSPVEQTPQEESIRLQPQGASEDAPKIAYDNNTPTIAIDQPEPVEIRPKGSGPDIQHFMDRIRQSTPLTGDLEADIKRLKGRYTANRIALKRVLKGNKDFDKSDLEAVYHHAEDSSHPLTPKQQAIFDNYYKPLKDAESQATSELTGNEPNPNDNYIHRIAQNKGSNLEGYLNGRRQSPEEGVNRKTVDSQKGRTIKVLTDENGNRIVASIKAPQDELGKSTGSKRVTAFIDREPVDLGTFNAKPDEALMNKDLEPIVKEMDRLSKEKSILSATKGRAAAAARRLKSINKRLDELNRDYANAVNEHDINDLNNKRFIDKNGKRYTISDATTKEIEANTNLEYYKEPILNTALNLVNTVNANAAKQFMENWKLSPDFSEHAVKIGEGAIPDGWKPADNPAFRGYYFDPKTADTINKYMGGSRREVGIFSKAFNGITSLATQLIVLNPYIHGANLYIQGLIKSGNIRLGGDIPIISKLPSGPIGMLKFNRSLLKLGSSADREAILDDYLRGGGHFMTYGKDTQTVLTKALDRAGLPGINKLNADAMSGIDATLRAGLWDASKDGVTAPDEVIKDIDRFMGDEAHVDEFSRGIVLFYHWLRTEVTAISSQIGHPIKNVGATTNTALLFAAITYGANAAWQKLTGNKNAHVRLPGELGLINDIAKIPGQIQQGQVPNVVTSHLNPVINSAINQAAGKDLYTGQPVVTPRQRANELVQNLVAPAQMGSKVTSGKSTALEQIANEFGLYTPHVKGTQAAPNFGANNPFNTKGSTSDTNKAYAAQQAWYNAYGAQDRSLANDPHTQQEFEAILSRTHNDSGQTVQLSPAERIGTYKEMLGNSKLLSSVQSVEKAQPSHDPMWDLSSDKLNQFLDYESQYTGDPERTRLEEKYTWLPNFIQQRNNYYNQQTFSGNSVAPSGMPQYPTFDAQTTADMNTAQNISDPTQYSDFISSHPDVIAAQQKIFSQYTNPMRIAEGALPLQPAPQPSAHVQAVLNSMPSGSDKASKKARALLINGDPDVNQYLADHALWATTKNLAGYYLQINPKMTEGQELNNGSSKAQSTLKNLKSIGSYDIGKDANGDYQFMQGGGFGDGYSSGGGGGSSYKSSSYSKKPPFFIKKRVTKVRPHYAKKAHKVFLNKGKPIKIASGGAGKHSAVKIKSGGKSIKIAKAKAPTKTASKTGVTFV